MRTVLPGMGFALAIVTMYFLYLNRHPLTQLRLFGTPSTLNSAAIVATTAVFYLIASGIGINFFVVGSAKRRDRSLWWRLLFPLILGTVPWFFAFVSLSSYVLQTTHYNWYAYEGAMRRLYGTPDFLFNLGWITLAAAVIFQLSLSVPFLLFKSKWVRILCGSVGLAAAATLLLLPNMIAQEGSRFYFDIHNGDINYALIIGVFAVLISVSTFLAEAWFPQKSGSGVLRLRTLSPSKNLQQVASGIGETAALNQAIVSPSPEKYQRNRQLASENHVHVVNVDIAATRTVAGMRSTGAKIKAFVSTHNKFVLAALACAAFLVLGSVAFGQISFSYLLLGMLIFTFTYAVFGVIAAVSRRLMGMSPEQRQQTVTGAVGILAVLGTILAAFAAVQSSKSASEEQARNAAAAEAAKSRQRREQQAKTAAQQASTRQQAVNVQQQRQQAEAAEYARRQAEIQAEFERERRRQQMNDDASFADHLRRGD